MEVGSWGDELFFVKMVAITGAAMHPTTAAVVAIFLMGLLQHRRRV
jgi:hypothetical protein